MGGGLDGGLVVVWGACNGLIPQVFDDEHQDSVDDGLAMTHLNPESML